MENVIERLEFVLRLIEADESYRGKRLEQAKRAAEYRTALRILKAAKEATETIRSGQWSDCHVVVETVVTPGRPTYQMQIFCTENEHDFIDGTPDYLNGL